MEENVGVVAPPLEDRLYVCEAEARDSVLARYSPAVGKRSSRAAALFTFSGIKTTLIATRLFVQEKT